MGMKRRSMFNPKFKNTRPERWKLGRKILGIPTEEEVEAKLKAEQEAKLKAEQEAKLKAEQEAKLKTEQENLDKEKSKVEIKNLNSRTKPRTTTARKKTRTRKKKTTSSEE